MSSTNLIVKRRGRPRGSFGKAEILQPAQVDQVFRSARISGRHSDRAEAVHALSILLGLRTNELAALQWKDAFGSDGLLRQTIRVRRLGSRSISVREVMVTSRQLRQILVSYGEKRKPWHAGGYSLPFFASQRGGHMTAASMTRFVIGLYQAAGLVNCTSRSGRRTLMTKMSDWNEQEPPVNFLTNQGW